MSALIDSQHLKIPLKEIEIATKNFQMCIGKGGYGMVYKGELSIDGNLTTVAVKRLNKQFGQGLKEFLIEIQLLTGQSHPNLITLIGYCDEGKEKIIVYEYAENGSLDQYLRNSNTVPALTWLERLKICVDAARGLNHLHNHVGKHQTIIHRDIKSANILIDHKLVAKISDLGLSKLSLAGLNRSAVISHACGTHGYCEPEYLSTGIVKKESDVYSFGMVLFEVLCGRLCFIMGDDGFLLSAKSVKNYYEEKNLDEIVDPILREQISSDLMNQFATIAYNCLNDNRGERPPMDFVANELEELFRIQLSSNPLETPLEIRSDIELHTFDETLQAQAKTVIDAFDLEVGDGAMSFYSLKETTEALQEMDQQVVKVILHSVEHVGKNRKWVKVVEDYIDASLQTLELIDSLRTCLKREQETRILIIEAVRNFDDENGVKRNSYWKALDNLKKFKAAGHPFTQDFLRIFNFVYKRQITFLKKLQRKQAKVYKELKQKWLGFPLVTNEIEGQKEVFSSLQMASYIAISDLDTIITLVNRLTDFENHVMNTKFTIKIEDVLRLVIKNIKTQFDPFLKNVEDLEYMATECTGHIGRARIVILRRLVKLFF